jgi:hypothetical protein
VFRVGGSRRRSGTGHNRVAQHPDGLDFDFDHIAGAHDLSGGLRLQPTPAGVPVAITSPGTSVKMVEA